MNRILRLAALACLLALPLAAHAETPRAAITEVGWNRYPPRAGYGHHPHGGWYRQAPRPYWGGHPSWHHRPPHHGWHQPRGHHRGGWGNPHGRHHWRGR